MAHFVVSILPLLHPKQCKLPLYYTITSKLTEITTLVMGCRLLPQLPVKGRMVGSESRFKQAVNIPHSIQSKTFCKLEGCFGDVLGTFFKGDSLLLQKEMEKDQKKTLNINCL